MIPDLLSICKQVLNCLCVDVCMLSVAATKLSAAATEAFSRSLAVATPGPLLSYCVIFYLHVCAELNCDSAPQQEA